MLFSPKLSEKAFDRFIKSDIAIQRYNDVTAEMSYTPQTIRHLKVK